jgi:tRNA dimethylallyltransferase
LSVSTEPFVIVVAGPTGAGKSELAVRLALELGGEIVNYDSVQIYRGFDLGSAKPGVAQQAQVPHHLLDIADACDECNAADFGRLARETCAAIRSRGRQPVLAGGTNFYLRAFLSGLPEMPGRDDELRGRLNRLAGLRGGPERLHRWLSRVDPVSAARIAVADRYRVGRALEVWLTTGRPISSWERPAAGQPEELPALKIALSLERPRLVELLDRRVDAMYAAGLVEETGALLLRYAPECRPFAAIGYKEAAAVVLGTMSASDAIAETKRRTRAYAKRQMSWLRGERGIHWLDASAGIEQNLAAALELVRRRAQT